jgi:hypothetical protein
MTGRLDYLVPDHDASKPTVSGGTGAISCADCRGPMTVSQGFCSPTFPRPPPIHGHSAFKTGRPWQPQGWKVRFLRRSVVGNPAGGAGFRPVGVPRMARRTWVNAGLADPASEGFLPRFPPRAHPIERFSLTEEATHDVIELARLLGTEPPTLAVRLDHELVEQALALKAAHKNKYGSRVLIVAPDVADGPTPRRRRSAPTAIGRRPPVKATGRRRESRTGAGAEPRVAPHSPARHVTALDAVTQFAHQVIDSLARRMQTGVTTACDPGANTVAA